MASNLFEFAIEIFDKAVTGSYPARKGTEPVRQAIIDFEGPKDRNIMFDLDHTAFYYLQFHNKDYWIGTCDDIHLTSGQKSETISKYSELFHDLGKVIIIPPINTKTSDNAAKFIKVMHDCLMDIIYPDDTWDGEYLCQIKFAIIHLITWYIYQQSRINLTHEATFEYAFLRTGILDENTSSTYYEFFKKDFEYVNTLSREFPNKYKILGSFTRWRREYGNTVSPIVPIRNDIDEDGDE